jgi:hypothetical protein
VIYSRWRPDRGGYDYFESPERRGLGDDLPAPRMLGGTQLGIASTEAGRRPPGGMRHVGAGALPRGSILPLSRAGLSGFGAVSWLGAPWVSYMAGILTVVGGVWLWERYGRRRRG